ncbi:uncharacterized protein LOC6565226 [Drosophila grimshawi]|uniref:GH12173 n=1 Tax=Drosophila grimshawi TaxID=7222 RepID=B4JJV3_DROGR|nr:uncharacterized protein LOC6565226 [Drosophila grimshawi]XP_032594168.1 uncharacterized protein LOC6565226 [Drosophila grimshawi]XP_043072116.1 uncharacterized protein LOC6565226 [Drosophila grimshawi]EDV99855.1 GH12173 [Drosophila grimshawi]
MAPEHTFLGTWEIVACTFEGKRELSGLEGIKFRLDDTNDITWYNDLVSPLPEIKDCGICCDSASVLFSCETFDVYEVNPRLIFGAFAGHSIEFSTSTLLPTDTLVLSCENWYAVECRRLQEDQAAGQEEQFSFGEALLEKYFSDVMVKSASGFEYALHASILRLNGFDCSMCTKSVLKSSHPLTLKPPHILPKVSNPNPVRISIVTAGATAGEEQQKLWPSLSLSPIYLQPPCELELLTTTTCGGLGAQRLHHLSNSFNCLSNGNEQDVTEASSDGGNGIQSVDGGGMRRFPPNSHSDSHLEVSQVQCKNIFNFCQDMMLQPMSCSIPQSGLAAGVAVCNTRRPPLSPYRARSPLPFPSSMETPPSSPLTPVGVLYNLPTFLLTAILHWLYTESLLPELDEDICEKLIHFAEAQPSLIKLVEPTRKYLRLLQLKKFVVNVTMDLHSILNRVIRHIDPASISHEPALLYATFKDGLRECAVGCAKVLQFCNIFIKDATHLARYQKNEIVKYVRTRIPIFISQVQQLLRNTRGVFVGLSIDEKEVLVNYLVPEIESTLLILTTVIEEIKSSLDTMCKDLKCTDFDQPLEPQQTEGGIAMQMQCVNRAIIGPRRELLSPHPRRGPPIGLTLYDNPSEQRFSSAENDLKFVLYMYEVRKMRDIYGRITAALEIIKDKKRAFCEMDLLSKRSTINQNLEQLIVDIPAYIFIIENLSDRLNDKLGWKEFKFCFKLATSQINGVIVKLLDHKSALRHSIEQICKLVRKQEFLNSIIELGLLESSTEVQNDCKMADHENNLDLSQTNTGTSPVKHYYDYKNIKLNLIRHLCEPPIAANSNLSKNALRLLHSAQLADMEFEVHTYAPSAPAEEGRSTYTIETMNTEANPGALKIHSLKAHRIIVASRCEWFKKALMSGMQESINRKIIITDTSPVIFRRLLLYLYGAPIDRTVGAEQLCELMLLADRYSLDNLKELCETTLNSLIDEDSVVCLLGIADRYVATVLKTNCLSFLSQHAHLTKSEIFKELPQTLQLEVLDLVNWFGRVTEPWNDSSFKARSNSRCSLKSPSKPHSRSRKSSPSNM